MAKTQTLEELLASHFAPKKTKVKGEPKIIIVVNGTVITERIKSKKALEKQLRSMAIEDARLGRTTEVLVYTLEGKANTTFDMNVDIAVPNKDTEGDA